MVEHLYCAAGAASNPLLMHFSISRSTFLKVFLCKCASSWQLCEPIDKASCKGFQNLPVYAAEGGRKRSEMVNKSPNVAVTRLFFHRWDTGVIL